MTPGTSRQQIAALIPDRRILLLLVVVFVASLSVRLYKLTLQSLECDELYTVPAATGHQYVHLRAEQETKEDPFPTTSQDYRKLLQPDSDKGLSDVSAVLKRNVHLPLYFHLMHYWLRLFGTTETALRLPSVIFGSLMVLVIFLLGHELSGPRVGLIAAIFVGFMPEQIYFSQQARMYPLLALLAISSTYAITLGKRFAASRWVYVLYGLTSVAGLYTHYEYVFCFAAQMIYIWFGSTLGRDRWRRWLLTQALVMAACLPWMFAVLAQRRASPEIIAWVRGSVPASLVITEIVFKITQLISVPEAPLGWLSVILAYSLLVVGIVALRNERATLLMLCFWIVFPIAGVITMDALLGTHAISITRYWVVISPAFYLLMSVGVAAIKRQPLQIAVVALFGGFLLAAAVLTAQGKLRVKPDRHREMAQFIDSQTKTNETVITEGINSLPLALAYYGHNEIRILRYKWVGDKLKQQPLNEITGGHKAVWLLVSGRSTAAKLLEDNGFRLEGEPILFGHILVARYVGQR